MWNLSDEGIHDTFVSIRSHAHAERFRKMLHSACKCAMLSSSLNTASAQAKSLRVRQEREFQRLGGTRTLKADIRVIAATNRDLAEAVERGTFREDHYRPWSTAELALIIQSADDRYQSLMDFAGRGAHPLPSNRASPDRNKTKWA